jgi:hypothetical protein
MNGQMQSFLNECRTEPWFEARSGSVELLETIFHKVQDDSAEARAVRKIINSKDGTVGRALSVYRLFVPFSGNA